jgi:hypothetical protein
MRTAKNCRRRERNENCPKRSHSNDLFAQQGSKRAAPALYAVQAQANQMT